jgi:hypothetical protein
VEPTLNVERALERLTVWDADKLDQPPLAMRYCLNELPYIPEVLLKTLVLPSLQSESRVEVPSKFELTTDRDGCLRNWLVVLNGNSGILHGEIGFHIANLARRRGCLAIAKSILKCIDFAPKDKVHWTFQTAKLEPNTENVLSLVTCLQADAENLLFDEEENLRGKAWLFLAKHSHILDMDGISSLNTGSIDAFVVDAVSKSSYVGNAKALYFLAQWCEKRAQSTLTQLKSLATLNQLPEDENLRRMVNVISEHTESDPAHVTRIVATIILWHLGEALDGYGEMFEGWTKFVTNQANPLLSVIRLELERYIDDHQSYQVVVKCVLQIRTFIVGLSYQAAENYAKFLQSTCEKRSYRNMDAPLCVLRLVAQFSSLWATSSFDVDLLVKQAESDVTVQHWIQVVPQLLARLSTTNDVAQSVLLAILRRIATRFPSVLSYPLLGYNQEESAFVRKPWLQELLSTLSNANAGMVKQAKQLIDGLCEISVLPEEKTLHYLMHIHSDGDRRFDQFAQYVKQMHRSGSLGEEQLKMRYLSLIQPLAVSLENHANEMRNITETRHGMWYKETWLSRLEAFVTDLNNPDFDMLQSDPLSLRTRLKSVSYLNIFWGFTV